MKIISSCTSEKLCVREDSSIFKKCLIFIFSISTHQLMRTHVFGQAFNGIICIGFVFPCIVYEIDKILYEYIVYIE